MTVLSVFVKHYTKSQLHYDTRLSHMADRPDKKARGSGWSRCDWRAAICGSLQAQKPKPWSLPGRHQLPHYIQDVVYSTKKLQMSTGEVLQIPNVVRAVLTSRVVALYQNYCCEIEFEHLVRLSLFAMLKVNNPVQSACLLYTFPCVSFLWQCWQVWLTYVD